MAVVLAAVSLVAARSADARPKRRDSKAAFDRGVTAYQKGNYQGASEALAKSFELERDVDTLFAWAQAERKLEHCDKAIELYEQLLTFNLPGTNRSAVEGKLFECREIVAQQKPPPSAPPPSEPVKPPAPPPPPPVSSPPAVTPPSAPAPSVAASTAAQPPPETPPSEPQPSYVFWKDRYALALFGAGAVGLGVGISFYASGASERNKIAPSPTLAEAQGHHDREKSRKATGVVLSSAGLLCVGGGLVWTYLHRRSGERMVTGWLAPGGGGLAIAGPF